MVVSGLGIPEIIATILHNSNEKLLKDFQNLCVPWIEAHRGQNTPGHFLLSREMAPISSRIEDLSKE